MKKIFMILFAGLLIPAGLQAQEVYIENGKVILDLTEAAGMPAGAITDIPKSWVGEPAVTSINDINNTSLINNRHSESINATVFQKLEIAPSDLKPMTWVNAFNACKSKGEGWRLPTQRELLLICIFKKVLENDVLKGVAGGTAFNGNGSVHEFYYWCATESNGWNAWIVDFKDDISTAGHKAQGSYAARCVREITN
jgi:hypothetical protein